ncbi:MAG: hypothetical protein WCK11_05170 [Candidatus Falkowbacteria bacterium]
MSKFSTRLTVLFIILAIAGGFYFTSNHATSNNQAYYSGKAISYRGQVIFGTVNRDQMELFRMQGNGISRVAMFGNLSADHRFNDLAFNQEGSDLYLYLIDGFSIYKYRVSEPTTPVLVSQTAQKETNEWLKTIRIAGDRIVTVGNNGIKTWSTDLQAVVSTKIITNTVAENVNFSPEGAFVFSQEGTMLSIYNMPGRNVNMSSQKLLDYQIGATNDLTIDQASVHKVFNDTERSMVYIVDDMDLRKMDMSANTYKTFRHISTLGYDVAGTQAADHLYFSDGIGVVKFNKDSLKPIKWRYTTNLADGNGWAMGMEVVNYGSGERVILFNNANIVLMDENLKVLDTFVLRESDPMPIVEPMSLRTDRNRAAANSEVMVSGTGFSAGEQLRIDFVSSARGAYPSTVTVATSFAGTNGRFAKIVSVPSTLKKGQVDIIVTGLASAKHYNTSFTIE